MSLPLPSLSSSSPLSTSGGGGGGDVNSRGGGSFSAYHFASFAAMEMSVTIIPRFTMPRVTTLFGGSYGPFAPNYPVDVPLWLAMHIRQTDTCVITPPQFMAISYLRNVVAKEKESEVTFEMLPFYFFEIVKKLCENSAAAEDVPHVAEVLRLVAEVKAIRRQKLQRSMSVFEAEGSPVYIPGIKLTNIVNNEFEFLRSSFAKVLFQSAEMKRRREKIIGGPININTGSESNSNNNINAAMMRSSGTLGQSTLLSSLALSPLTTQQEQQQSLLFTPSTSSMAVNTLNINNNENNNNTDDGVVDANLANRRIMDVLNGPGQLHSRGEEESAGNTATSFVGTETTTTRTTTDELVLPPVKKRRTLRQT